jgi:hypothetical protein
LAELRLVDDPTDPEAHYHVVREYDGAGRSDLAHEHAGNALGFAYNGLGDVEAAELRRFLDTGASDWLGARDRGSGGSDRESQLRAVMGWESGPLPMLPLCAA